MNSQDAASVSASLRRRSLCPKITSWQPASTSMVGLTSPVKAPSLLQETFWPEMAILAFFAASAAAEIAVKGGAMTMSQCLEFATSGAKVEKKARVSATVLYIFQLPAITRRRIHTPGQNKKKEEKDNAESAENSQ